MCHANVSTHKLETPQLCLQSFTQRYYGINLKPSFRRLLTTWWCGGGDGGGDPVETTVEPHDNGPEVISRPCALLP